MGNDSRGYISKFMARHLLDLTIPDMVDNAVDAIVPEGWRFHIQRQIEGGPD